LHVVTDDDGALVVSGVVDVATCDDLDRALVQLLDDASGQVVINMAGVEFMDSSGLRVLLTVQRRCVDRGLDFRLVDPSSRVRLLLEITGLMLPAS
jgi:anti-sigma B factor antagonist